MIISFNILSQPSWDVQQFDIDNLQDQDNRMDDSETNAEIENLDH